MPSSSEPSSSAPNEPATKKARVGAGAERAAMIEITKGVEFDTVAREVRCKWSEDDDKASLAALQQALDGVKAQYYATKGVRAVQRVVCGGCHDFKVVVSVAQPHFGAFEASGFGPEKEFVDAIGKIDGVSQVETQNYTLMSA